MSLISNQLYKLNKISLIPNVTSFLRSNLNFLTKSLTTSNVLNGNSKNNELSSSLAENSKNLQTKNNDKNIFENINKLIRNNSEGRLFAVIQVLGKQYKITEGDILIVQGNWPPTIGDRIRLDKVLLAGCKDFTLVGKPILENGLIDVQATIIEKTLSHTRTNFRKRRRKQFMRINFFRSQNTMLRINSIEMKKPINENCEKNEKNNLRLF